MSSPVSQVQPKIETAEILPFMSDKALQRAKQIVAIAGGVVAAYVSPVATCLSGFFGAQIWDGRFHFIESSEDKREFKIHCIQSIAKTGLLLSCLYISTRTTDVTFSTFHYPESSLIPTFIPALFLGHIATSNLLTMLSSKPIPTQVTESK